MDYYTEIKDKLFNNEIRKKVKDYSKNKSDLQTYYDVGEMFVEAQGGEKRTKYGDKLIKEYSNRLINELGKGYTYSALKRMRQFYLIVKIGATMSHTSTWSHYVELLKFKDIDKINYYINISIKQNLSVRELRSKIQINEYERLDEKTKNKVKINKNIKINDLIKNPILIKNIYKHTKISENILKQLILEDIENFLMELGDGFCFIRSKYKIKLSDRYNYVDLLLYNIKYNCYVVVELKMAQLKKDNIDQIQVYMNYIDKNIKTFTQDKTIGIIICKKDNQYIIEYSSDDRIYTSTYILH